MTQVSLFLHSMATPEQEPRECGLIAAALQLDGIELIIDDSYRCAVRPTASGAHLAVLRRSLVDVGAPVRVLSSYQRGLADAAAAEVETARDDVRRALGIAHALGATGLRILAGRRAAASDAEWTSGSRALVASLRSLVADAHAAGVTLLVENHMDTLADSAKRTAGIVRAVDDPAVGVLYDPANLEILHAESAETAVPLQAPFIRHVHVKNFVPRAGDRAPRALSEGRVVWRDVARALSGYEGSFTFEYERRWYPLPPAEQGLAGDIRYLRELLAQANTHRQERRALPQL